MNSGDEISQDTLDALEMISFSDVPVQGKIQGFTPLFDVIAEKYGMVRAAVFGKVWRYCQMHNRVCRAKLETLADGLGVDRATVKRHLDGLCEDGYLEDKTPDLRNRPHVYRDTGKVKIEMNIHVAQSSSENFHVAESNSHVAQDHSHVAQSHMSIDLKKDIKKEQPAVKKELHGKPPEMLITAVSPYLQEQLNTLAEGLNRKAPIYFETPQQRDAYSAVLEKLNGKGMEMILLATKRNITSRSKILAFLEGCAKNMGKARPGNYAAPAQSNGGRGAYRYGGKS
jgi:hypothetical protein